MHTKKEELLLSELFFLRDYKLNVTNKENKKNNILLCEEATYYSY